MTAETETDLRIDAFDYARKYRAIKELSEKIKAATKDASLDKFVFFDGVNHFRLESPFSSDAPLKVVSVEFVKGS